MTCSLVADDDPDRGRLYGAEAASRRTGRVNLDVIASVVSGTYPDPDGGPALGVPVRAVEIAETLEGDEANLVASLELGARLALVSDALTHEVLGARVARVLSGSARLESLVLDNRPRADIETVAKIRTASSACDALIAVGSGTINDLCKYAAALDNKPYVVFATAPSMNGYTSVNAAITVAGHKKSLPACAPQGVFMDLRIMAAAPPRMIRAGLGDSLCRPTAQADWLLANAIRGDAYREAPFALLVPHEGELLESSHALLSGDLDAMRHLACTLVLSGFGMTICGGSMPASQGEHLIGHYAEMRAPAAWPESFHGEQIGVATLAMARLQERLLEGDAPELTHGDPGEDALLDHFGPEIGSACWDEFRAKRMQGRELEAANDRLGACWQRLRERIEAVSRSAEVLERTLGKAGAPVRAAELGWSGDFYRAAVRHAREIRNRYTFLDLAAQCGTLDEFIAGLRAGDAP